MAVLVTGALGTIGRYLGSSLECTRLTHDVCDLTNWNSVKRFEWEGDTIVHCAHSGIYGQDRPGLVEENVAMFVNMRRRWPEAKIIAFGSGAMYDKSKPIVEAKETDVAYPSDSYGMSKRLTLDLADVTLIPFGLYSNTRFVRVVRERPDDVRIYQDIKFSWVNLSDMPEVIKWATDKKGRYNLVGYNMTLTEMAVRCGATKITYLQQGMGNEYTGKPSIVPLTTCSKD